MAIVYIDKLSLVDFDEYLCATIFTAGCNFRCPFCHNGALVLNQDTNVIPFSNVLTFLKDRKGKLDAVTYTGGEPTLHPTLKEELKEIKKLGYLIKLDTNGSNPKLLKELIDEKLIDYVAMDIKNSYQKYKIITSSPNLNLDKIKESINIIMNSNIDYEFRTTIIEEFHDINDIKEIANMIKGAKRYRLQKYVDRDSCLESGFHEINKNVAQEWVDILSNDIDDVSLRGY